MTPEFPRSAGPLVGAAAGIVIGGLLVGTGGMTGIPSLAVILGSTLFCGFVGLLVMFLDRRPRDADDATDESRPPDLSIVKRVILLAGVFLCWFPYVGGVLAVATLFATAGRTDRARTLSWIAAVVAVMVHCAILLLYATTGFIP